MASMTLSSVVGAMKTDSAKITIRTDAAADVVVEHDTDPNFGSPAASATGTTASGGDFTHTFELSGLSADTRYYYRVKVDGVVQQFSGIVTRFDTFPTSGEYTFAVFADVATNDRAAPAYKSAADEGPLFAVQLGDLPHGSKATLAAMRTAHRGAKDPSLLHGSDFVKRILSKRALVHIWDDWDYGNQDEDKDFAGRSDAWQAFDEHWPTYDRPNAAAGLWHSFVCGDAEFFVLDNRSQSDAGTDTDNSDKSRLDGDQIADDQKDWLFDGLANSTKTWKIIISSVSFNETARQGRNPSTDMWHSYGTEAQELADHIANENIDGVIVLSGDLHAHGIDDGTNSLLGMPEMVTTHTNLAGGNANRVGTWSEGSTPGKPGGAGFSRVTVNSTSVKLEAYAANGTLRHSYTVT